MSTINTPVGLERCFSFINLQLQPGNPLLSDTARTSRRAVTLSRQSGCGAHVVAEKLTRLLQERAPQGAPPWTVFDRNLVEKVLQDHQLPERLAKFMPEDRVLEVQDIVDELFGLHPPSWTLVPQTAETILRLAELGNVIIVGRGANVITAKLPYVVHVRMVASVENRLKHMQEFEELDKKTAMERIQREDLGRRRYLKKHFNKEIDDPLLYHLMINTDSVSLDDAARMIADLVVPRPSAPGK